MNTAVSKPLSVSELTARLKAFIERQFADVFVEGEISNLRPAASGHVYFVLKDARATINCVLWAAAAARLTRPLREGEKVEVRGRIALYEPRGQYQIVADSIRPAGLGKLFLAFQELKERLQREGLFDESRKRPLPRMPRAVGVVTSPTGAAIRDILNVLTRRAPHIAVTIYPVRVQGEGAAREIARAISRMNTIDWSAMPGVEHPPAVLIVGRGGGSIKDLWAFNEEIVARSIAASRIPVISAVGHEVDFTIADFAADLRVPTPSAAAEIVARDSEGLTRELAHLNSRIEAALRRRTHFLREASHLRARLQAAIRPRIARLRACVAQFASSYALRRPAQRVNECRQRLDDLVPRLGRGLETRRAAAARKLERLAAQLTALNPSAILARGYSITFDSAKQTIVRSKGETYPGQALRIRFHVGHADVHVDGARYTDNQGQPRTTKDKERGGGEWFGADTDG
ncbi:MAG: exodeoxyribonuclease VII large subunit [Candidatus Sumerlaeota bacterium]|nr:exodeoxyribonuclease VII large subunit [Candidatus Sumerlaeota bacterium]